MSQKKPGKKPIRITLTEDQIADIIQSAARTRRSLGAQNLEDRIAPSAIGAPIVDPGLIGGDGALTPPQYDPVTGLPLQPPVDDPFFVDPNAPPPGELTPPSNDPEGFVAPLPPLDGGSGDVGGDVPFNPEPPVGDAPILPEDPMEDGPILPEDPMEDGPILPPDLSEEPIVPETPPGEGEPIYIPTDNLHGNQVPGDAAPAPTNPPVESAMPSSEELEEHRRNLLRQLRG
jgi:hypothetical protein